jgi:serine/threonine-protein kinase
MFSKGAVLRSRYRVEAPIGHGGMGSVYLAEDMRLEGRKCAIKAVRFDAAMQADVIAELQRQFSREAAILARLDHPNLPKVSDYFSEDGWDFLVMDYVSGQNLKEIMDEARRTGRFLSEFEVLGWARQLCDALEYMHSQQHPVLHRDIKPSNIKLAPSGLIKLVDFGLVKLLSDDGSQTVTILQGRGTAAYTPLEQYGEDDAHTDGRSDLYALGATLYHLLTNTTPPEAKQRFLRPDALKRPTAINPTLTPTVEQAILDAMAMHPDDRPVNVAEFRAQLFTGTPDLAIARSAEAARAAAGDSRPHILRDNAPWLAASLVALLAGLLVTLQ